MAAPVSTHQGWRFGVFEVDARRGELRRSGAPLKLREQSFQILIALLENPGEIVSREELRHLLWPSHTFVDFDHSLNTAMMKLRDALGDSTDAPIYIETIPKRGYRFIAPVAPLEKTDERQETGGAAKLAANEEERTPPVSAPLRRPAFAVATTVALALLAALGFLLFLLMKRGRAPQTENGHVSSTLPAIPITSGPGDAILPVLSPDEKWVAYVWNGPERNFQNVYVQLLQPGIPFRLTYNKFARIGTPAWSPDGSEIAFTRCDGRDDAIFAVPSTGGAERRLTSGFCPSNTGPGPVAWLDEGDILSLATCRTEAPPSVALISLSTGEKRCLGEGPDTIRGEGSYGFVLSPDHKFIAVTATTRSQCCNIYTVPVVGSGSKRLTSGLEVGCIDTSMSPLCSEVMWTPDSRSIVFRSGMTKLPWLWRVSAEGGKTRPEIEYPAIGSLSKDGHRLIYSEMAAVETPAIWRADLASPGGEVLQTQKLIGTQTNLDAQPSSDGKRLAWMSNRSGFFEIWVGDSMGQNPLQLTHMERYCGSPRWSPDGKWIAFDSQDLGNASGQIYVVDTEGKGLHVVTTGPKRHLVPSWSRDGKFIYCVASLSASERRTPLQLCRQALQKDESIQLTSGPDSVLSAFESPDGSTLYFTRFRKPGIWSIPAGGGAETQILADKPQYGFWGYWAVTQEGIYLLNADAEPRPTIEFYSFATRKITSVLTLDKQPAIWQPSLSATPDGKRIYYAQLDRHSVIKMMEFQH